MRGRFTDDLRLSSVRFTSDLRLIRVRIAFEFRPICGCLSSGRCPYADVLPLQGAIPFKPSRGGGTQGVVHYVHFTLG